MIRVEVASEADVTRMTAAFQTLPALRDQDYEIFLLPLIWPHDSAGTLRAWRKDGLRGGTGQTNTIVYAGGPADLTGGGGGGGNVTGGPPRAYMIGGICATCGNPVPGGSHTDECTGLVPGSEYLIGGGGGLPDRDGKTGKGGPNG